MQERLKNFCSHCSQVILFNDPSFVIYKIFFQDFFLLDEYSFDLQIVEQQQSQDPVLQTFYTFLSQNAKPEPLTP